MARYCDGLLEHGTRALDPAERARVAAARRSWGLTAAARAALVPLALAASIPIGLAAEVVLPERAAQLVAGAAMLAAIFLLVPWALVAAREALRVRAALGRDLAAGEAIAFGDPARPLVVLPASSLVLARDGAPVELSARAEVGEAAPAPEAAPTYGVAADADSARAHGWVRRALAPAEREELRRVAAALRRPPVRLAAVTAIFAALAASAIRQDRAASLALVLAFGAVVLGTSWTRWLRGRALGARLLADEAEGWIVRATAGELAGTEVLPGSGAQWTDGGAPSAWRLRAGSRRSRR